MVEDVEQYLSSVAGLYIGSREAIQLALTLKQNSTVFVLAQKCPDTYLATMATRIFGKVCTSKNGHIDVPITFLTEEAGLQFGKKLVDQLVCQGCGRISFEFSQDKKRTIVRCTVCGHVRSD